MISIYTATDERNCQYDRTPLMWIYWIFGLDRIFSLFCFLLQLSYALLMAMEGIVFGLHTPDLQVAHIT